MKFIPYKLVHYNKLAQEVKKTKALEDDIKNSTLFIKHIEEGNLDAKLESNDDFGNSSLLSNSLLSMRDKMKRIAEEERERNWATEGLAKFVEILRTDDEGLSILANKILTHLIKYIHANQGYLFIVNDNDPANIHLQLEACYAYNRKKYFEKSINIGEGLLGQCYIEKDIIYMTEIPEDYVKITSGVGEALPKNLVIFPLKINEIVFGIIEMASFNILKPYQIEFLSKLGESIASTISNVKVNERTKKLLIEAQQMTTQLRAQEEEMRQNMEELNATQDEILRKQKEVEGARLENDRLKEAEAERAAKVAEMQKNSMLTATIKLNEKVAELQSTKAEMEKSKKEVEKLLAESQNQTEELRAQEEEL